MISSPSFVSLLPYLVRNRWRIVGGSAEERTGDQERLAFELTLLTFCPPGPELRVKERESSLAGIVNRPSISNMLWVPLSKDVPVYEEFVAHGMDDVLDAEEGSSRLP